MDRYGLYYNYKTIGDVLIIEFIPEFYPNRIVKSNDVVSLYKDDILIGINIFNISNIIKIKANGIIYKINDKVLEVINSILKNEGLNELSKLNDSGIKVCKIKEINEHPLSEHLHLVKVSIGSDKLIDVVCGAYNIKEDMKTLYASLGSFLPNGKRILPSKLLKEDSFGMLCSTIDLNLTSLGLKRGLIDLSDTSLNIGDDFF